MANATRAGTTLLRSCLCRSAVAVRPFAHLRILYAGRGPGCKSGPAGFKAGQAFTAVYNRASRLYSRPARFKTGRAAGFQAGQVYNRALTYIWLLWRHFCISRIQIDDAIASTTCVKANKEDLATRRILQARQLLTPPGTCLISNATILNAICAALLP